MSWFAVNLLQILGQTASDPVTPPAGCTSSGGFLALGGVESRVFALRHAGAASRLIWAVLLSCAGLCNTFRAPGERVG